MIDAARTSGRRGPLLITVAALALVGGVVTGVSARAWLGNRAAVQSGEDKNGSDSDERGTPTGNEGGRLTPSRTRSGRGARPNDSQVVEVPDGSAHDSKEGVTEASGRPGKPVQNVGNGVIVSDQGHILTASHICEGSSTVLINEGKRPATVVEVDEEKGLALLKMEGQGLPRAVISDSGRSIGSRELFVVGGMASPGGGDDVNQHGVETFPRAGPLRGEHAGNDSLFILNGHFNPGLSGSGLFDRHGELIGIVTSRPPGSGSAIHAIDIRNAIPLLTRNNVPFTTGGAPVELSTADLDRTTRRLVLTLRAAVGDDPSAACLPRAPRYAYWKELPFMGVAAFSADGETVAASRTLGSYNHVSSVFFFDAEDGREKVTIEGQEGTITSLVFSPNGKYLAATAWDGGGNKPTAIYDSKSSSLWNQLPGAKQVAFSADSSTIALSVGGKHKSWRLGYRVSDEVEVLFFDTKTGKKLAEVVPGNEGIVGEMDKCLFLPKSGTLLTLGFWYNHKRETHEILHEWDPQTGKLIRSIDLYPPIKTPESYLHAAMDVSSDQRWLVLDGCTEGATAVVYDFSSRRALYAVPHDPRDNRQKLGVWFLPGGEQFLLCSGSYMDKGLRLYETSTGTYQWRFDGWYAHCSPDGTRLLFPDNGHGYSIWNLPTTYRRSKPLPPPRPDRPEAENVAAAGDESPAAVEESPPERRPERPESHDVAAGDESPAPTEESPPEQPSPSAPEPASKQPTVVTSSKELAAALAAADEQKVLWVQLEEAGVEEAAAKQLRTWVEGGGMLWLDTDLAERFDFPLWKPKADQVPQEGGKIAEVSHAVVEGLKAGEVVKFALAPDGRVVAGTWDSLNDELTPILGWPVSRSRVFLSCAIRQFGRGVVVFRPRKIDTSTTAGRTLEENLRKFSFETAQPAAAVPPIGLPPETTQQ